MSVLQRAFKALSVLAIVGAVDLSITARVLSTSGTSMEPLQIVSIVLSVAFSLILGIAGLKTAGEPRRVAKLFLVTVLALWANACDILLLVLEGEFIFSVVMNALIVAAYAYVAYRVRREPSR